MGGSEGASDGALGGLGVGALEGREGVGAEVGQVGGAEGVFGRVFSSAPLLFVPTFAPYPHFSPHSDAIAPLLSLLCPSHPPFLPHSPIPPPPFAPITPLFCPSRCSHSHSGAAQPPKDAFCPPLALYPHSPPPPFAP